MSLNRNITLTLVFVILATAILTLVVYPYGIIHVGVFGTIEMFLIFLLILLFLILLAVMVETWKKLQDQLSERKGLEECLTKVNECLLNLGPDFHENVSRITALCGELFAGTCAMYNRLADNMLYAIGPWHAPPDFKPQDKPDGHICYDIIQGVPEGDMLVVPDLLTTRYAETDGNVRRYGLRSYMGHAVRCGQDKVGALCVVFQQRFVPTENDRKLFGILASAISVEESRHAAEQALVKGRQRFQPPVEAASDWIWEVDAQGCYTYASPRCKDILGYEPEELIGKTPFDLMPPDEARRVRGLFETIAAGRRPFANLENLNLHKEGRQVMLETSGVPILDDRGNLTGYRGVARDITERIEAERMVTMLSEAIENAHHGCLMMTEDYKVVFGNHYALAKLGLDLDELKRLDWFSLCADREQIGDAMKTIKITRRWAGEVMLTQKDGGQFPALMSITAIEADGRKAGPESYIILFQDISTRKELQNKLLTSEKLAVMGRLVADVSHEINNPLAIIIGGTQLMLSKLDEKQTPFKDQLETTLRNARRCKTILGNLLGYSRTLGRKEETINLPSLIREAIDDVSYQYDMSGIEMELNHEGADDAEIIGNRSALLSVFINLIRNARQAMGEKGRLTIGINKQKGNLIRVDIHDSGIGMSKKQIAKLFTPFVSGWKDGEGSGLGLATSLGIIETHGGSMTAESAGEGKGAMFTILLPCEFQSVKRRS